MSMAKAPDTDIAIVGGGIGGIYTGWRLLSADDLGEQVAPWAAARDGGLKISIFEGSDRIGGRLLSARSPHLPETTVEVGGMRNRFSVHSRWLLPPPSSTRSYTSVFRS